MKVLASVPSITLLGVSPSMAERHPMRGYVPSKINQRARHLWQMALASDEVRKAIEEKTPVESWYTLITRYYVLCEENDIVPLGSRDDLINDSVRRMCMNRRQALRIYMRRAGLFENTKVITPSIKHVWKFLPNGNLMLTASVTLQHDGVENLRTRVQSRTAKMFWNSRGNHWSFAVLPNLRVFVKNITRSRFTLSWQLLIRAPYYIPEDVRLVKDKKNYLDKEFFLPMVRGIRFENVRRIRF